MSHNTYYVNYDKFNVSRHFLTFSVCPILLSPQHPENSCNYFSTLFITRSSAIIRFGYRYFFIENTEQVILKKEILMAEPTNDPYADRRQHPRHPLALPWPAKGDFKGKNVDADIIDISIMGAKFLLRDFSITGFAPGHKIIWNIKLPSGGEVTTETIARWIHRFPEGFILGANFTNSTKDKVVEELHRLRQQNSAVAA